MANPDSANNIDPKEIRAQLDRIRSSAVFINSDRVSRFLGFVIEETLAGKADRIKQYSVAVKGLGEPEDFDPAINPAIRILARRVRRALKSYYEEVGAADPIRIEIPKGAYVPAFGRRSISKSEGPGRVAASRTDEPRIAVLPFTDLGEDPSTEHFAIGIAAELTSGLSIFRGLEVIGWHTAIHYAEDPSPTYRMSHDLGVEFVLTGSLYRSETTIRVASELIDTETAAVIWAETRTGDLSSASLFEIMDEITARIVASIGDSLGVIPRHLVDRAQRKRPDDLSAYEATLLFHDYLMNYTEEAYRRTRRAIEKAVETDPRYALGWAQLAELHCDAFSAWQDTEGWPDNALRCASRALALDPLCQEAWTVSAYTHFLNRDHEAAIHDAEEGVLLNPKAPFQVAWAGWIIGLSGRLDRGQQLIEDMERLNPFQPGWLRAPAYLAHLGNGDYQDCVFEARRIGMPEFPIDALMRAAAAGLADDRLIAVTAWSELEEKFPEVAANPADLIGIFFHFDHWVAPLLEGLDKAAAAARTDSP